MGMSMGMGMGMGSGGTFTQEQRAGSRQYTKAKKSKKGRLESRKKKRGFYTRCGARTHDHKIKSLALYRLS